MIGDGRWRVFLSHTSELSRFPPGRSFADAAAEAVKRVGGIPTDVRHLAAGGERPRAAEIRDAVASCDVYVGIIGFRYGSTLPDRPGDSYPKWEFSVATEHRLPRLVFLLDEERTEGRRALFWDPDFTRRQEEFRRLLSNQLTVARVATPAELESALIASLTVLRADAGAEHRKSIAAFAMEDPGLTAGLRVSRPTVGAQRLVERLDLERRLVELVERPGAVTIGLSGPAGSGKKTLASQVCALPEILVQFSGWMWWVTVGAETTGPELTIKINNLIEQISGNRPTFIDPEPAGRELGRVLDRTLHESAATRRALLVVDDVWTAEQLAPFLAGDANCVRLVTTRFPKILPPEATVVPVGPLAEDQTAAILTAGLSAAATAGVLAGLLPIVGGWPALGILINKLLRRLIETGTPPEAAVAKLVKRLSDDGSPAGRPTGGGPPPGAVDPARSLRRALSASLELLSSGELASGRTARWDRRFTELAILPENATIPLAALARYWQATGGVTEAETRRLADTLAALGLAVVEGVGEHTRVGLHDAIRAELVRRMAAELPGLHRQFVDAFRPYVGYAGSGEGTSARGATRWWDLGDDEPYLWTYLTYHLAHQASGPGGTDGPGASLELDELLGDLRWAVGKLSRSGPDALHADLARSRAPLVRRLRERCAQAAHLLTPLEPANGLAVTLMCRLSGDELLAPAVARYRAEVGFAHVTPAWPLPDYDPALLRVLAGHTGAVTAAAVAPDGRWLASAGEDGMVRIWDSATGTLQATLRATLTGDAGEPITLAVAPDGSRLASAGGDDLVRIWDLAAIQPHETADVRPHAAFGGHAGRVTTLVFAPDGSWLASAGADGTLRCWDPLTGMERAVLADHKAWVRALAVAPDGSWLASAGRDRTVKIWDLAGARLRGTFTGHSNAVTALAVAPDGSWLASAGADGTVRLWDPAAARELAVMTTSARAVTALAVAPDGSWLAGGSDDGGVTRWGLTHGSSPITMTGHARAVTALAVAPDGGWLASAGVDHTVRLWDPAGGRRRTTLTGHTRRVTVLAASPDGRWLASAGGDGTVRVWDAEHKPSTAAVNDLTLPMAAVAFTSDGRTLAGAGTDRIVRLWNLADGRPRATLTGHTGTITALAGSPNDGLLASGSHDGTIRLWRPASRKRTTTLTGHSGSVTGVAVASGGTWLASTGHDGTIRLWSTADGTRLATLTGHSGAATAVAVFPDEKWLASGHEDGTIRIWDVATGTERAALSGHSAWLGALAIAPDGTWLASGDDEGVVRIWEAQAMRPSAATRPSATLTGHTGAVRGLAIAPDGRWLASAGSDGTLRLWNAPDGAACTAVRVGGPLTGCAVAPDLRHIAASGTAGIYLFTYHPSRTLLADGADDT